MPEHMDSTTGGKHKPEARAVPSIALPKGGGALRAIDEKFQVNAVNGTAGVDVPLPFAQTRSGLNGSVGLHYSTGGGNGPFGLGWNVGLGSIQRRTDKQLPRYADADESDTFVIAGAEDLVPAYTAQPDGSWQRDTQTVGNATIERYRPRIEGGFSRIEKIFIAGETGAYWKVTSRENICTIYGRTAKARLYDPGDDRRIFRWLPEWSFDDKGNCVEYIYKAETLDNVPDVLTEKNRRSGVGSFANLYLKSISYGNKVPYYPDPAKPYDPAAPQNQSHFFQAVFDYGEHDWDAPAPAEAQTWPCRRDPFSECRAGFDIRTYRLCRRVLFFHRFAELGPGPCLVESIDLNYAHFAFQMGTVYDQEADYITSVQRTHYRRNGAGYDRKSTPAFELSYQPFVWDKTVHAISPEDVTGAPAGISEGYQWIDLYAEGLQGILTEQAEAWFYKQNLGGGRFSEAALVVQKPSLAGAGHGALAFQDLNADGSRQAVASGPLRGYFALTDGNEWQPFQTFAQDLKAEISDPNVKYLDLDGDGRPDVLISEEQLFRWYPSLGTGGYDAAQFRAKAWDEEAGPAIIFADGTETIFTADMNGDGLSEIVRIRNGEVCYWPNLGFGRFGAKVTMQNSPWFDHPDRFDPSRVQLGDISGTGAADIMYFGRDRMNAWINFAGNAWSAPQDIDPFPGMEKPNKVAVLDILGNGTVCLVWSSELPGNSAAPLRYVDLMGGKKPYILSSYSNNLGATVEVEFKSSSYYFLRDRAEGRPWATKLPFPVMCVSAVRTRESVTGSSYTRQFRYRHGYYDHAEREFRGFAMVEESDAESFDRYVATGATTLADQPVTQPPVRTRSWYHTGAFLDGAGLLRQFAQDYWVNPDLPEVQLPDAAIETEAGHALTPDEMREAARACKGMLLRREVYADDGTPAAATPYSVEESNCHIRLLQPRLDGRYAAYHSQTSETISYHYERDAADPRITHALNTAIDEIGNILEAAQIAYGRQAPDASLPPEIQQRQAMASVTYAVHDLTNDVDTPAAYRLRQLCEERSYELTGFTPAGRFATPDEIRGAFAAAVTLNYEDAPHPGVVDKRLLKWVRHLFATDTDPNAPAPLATLQSLGLAYQSYALEYTPGLLTALYGAKVGAAMLTEGAYLNSTDLKAAGLFPASDADDFWWSGNGTAGYPANPAQSFYLAETYRDPFGQLTTVHYYSDYQLLIDTVIDALGNETVVQQFDFRKLIPSQIKDINDNIAEVSIDILGLVVGTALLGKGAEADDLVGFVPDLSQAQIDAFLADPLANGAALLGNATSRFVYDIDRIPAVAAVIQRETHAKDAAAAGTPSRLHFAFEYSDGLGHVAMTKKEAEPGKALQCQAAGDGTFTVTTVDTGTAPRWVGSGRTVLNNKGNPVLKYEPYFSVTPAYESAAELVESGVSPVMTYDPLDRVIRTDFPDLTASRVEFDGWRELHFDRNDMVLASGWYSARIGGAMGPAAQAAAQRTALHDNTPLVAHRDPLGRTIYSVAHNKYLDRSSNAVVEEFYGTVFVYDVEGQQLSVRDPRGNTVQAEYFDLTGLACRTETADSSSSWIFKDTMGKALYGWDAAGNTFHTAYDSLHRPTQHAVTSPAAVTTVYDKSVYGSDKSKNQNGKLIAQYDRSGEITHDLFDFNGNTLSTTRTYTVAYTGDIDWSDPASVAMQADTYTTASTFDAMSRAVSVTTQDGSVTRDTYSVASLLTGIDVAIKGAAATSFIKAISHDAKGQRQQIAYGNGTSTDFTYDPLTFHVTRIVTTRLADGVVLQDLNYTYDPSGNVTTLSDAAQPAVYFAGAVVAPQSDFTYDAVYWLRAATGRELIGLNAAVGQFDGTRTGQPLPTDGSALRRYLQRYDYDRSGNMLAMAHASGTGPFTAQWTRSFTPDGTSNRLTSSQIGATTENYEYDVHGNITKMPGLAQLGWDFDNHFRSADLGGGGTAYYTYDSEGNRVRKVIERLGSIVEERLYIGVLEVFTRRKAAALDLRRESLHVFDGSARLAMVDSRTDGDDGTPAQLIRYQFSNNLGTALLELDDAAKIISIEEYYPFGNTSFQSVDASREVPAKRYRYTGKERDEETGLYYHGARYYAPWLARWTAADPLGIKDGLNRYSYSGNRPIGSSDPTGMWEMPSWRTVAVITAVVVVGAVVTVATAGAAGPVVAGLVASTTLTGTAATVVTGVVVGAVSGAVAGAASGAAGELTRQTVNSQALGLGHEHFSASRVGQEAWSGAKTGALVGAAVGGAAAFASTAAGTAVVGAVGRTARAVGARVVPGVIRQAAGSAVRAVAGAAQRAGGTAAGQLAQRGAQAVARGLTSIERAAASRGLQASRAIFAENSIGRIAAQRTVNVGVAATFNAQPRPPYNAQLATMPADEASGVLRGGVYNTNPTARNLNDLVTATGKIGGKQMSGQFMYVVDREGGIVIGSRAGQRMPHPTLIGGMEPEVQAAGIVDIRGGRIFSVDNASGHFQPGPESLAAARAAFERLPRTAFHRGFQGFVPFNR